MNAELRAAIQRIVDYNWPSEAADYERAEDEGNDQEGHVFEDLVLVNEWLNETADSIVSVATVTIISDASCEDLDECLSNRMSDLYMDLDTPVTSICVSPARAAKYSEVVDL